MKKTKSDILLILDIDETLIHATKTKLELKEDFRIEDYFIYKRPFLDDFLEYVFSTFLTAVWSSATDDYVKEVVDSLGIFENLEFVWGRSKATARVLAETDENGYFNLDRPSHFGYAKPLRKVKKKGYDLDKILIIDDTPEKVKDNYGNAIYVSEFRGRKDDAELKELMNFLETLKFEENVRKIEKRYWKKH